MGSGRRRAVRFGGARLQGHIDPLRIVALVTFGDDCLLLTVVGDPVAPDLRTLLADQGLPGQDDFAAADKILNTFCLGAHTVTILRKLGGLADREDAVYLSILFINGQLVCLNGQCALAQLDPTFIHALTVFIAGPIGADINRGAVVGF